jgi:hypothetical protein
MISWRGDSPSITPLFFILALLIVADVITKNPAIHDMRDENRDTILEVQILVHAVIFLFFSPILAHWWIF